MFNLRLRSIQGHIFTAFIFYILSSVSAYSGLRQSDIQKQYVNDFAGALNLEDQNKLNLLLSNFDRKTSVQMVIMIRPNISGKTIENYARELFRDWRIGQKSVNNGVLIALATQEKRAMIELGYGVEWPIGDNGADAIMKQMTSEISKGGFYKGLLVACQEIIRQTDQIDWKIGYHSIEELEKNKGSCMGKIVSFKAKLIKINSDNIVVAIKKFPNIKIEVTKHMNDLASILKKEKDKATIFGRVIKTDPFVFQLLGVLSATK